MRRIRHASIPQDGAAFKPSKEGRVPFEWRLIEVLKAKALERLADAGIGHPP
jgi:hypothetical protein